MLPYYKNMGDIFLVAFTMVILYKLYNIPYISVELLGPCFKTGRIVMSMYNNQKV